MRVWHLRLLLVTAIGDATGDDDGCFLLHMCVLAEVVSVEPPNEIGVGCMHGTDVPCQLCVASVVDTIECGWRISMLSIDTGVIVLCSLSSLLHVLSSSHVSCHVVTQ